MEPIKDASTELTTKSDHGQLTSVQLETANIIYNDALRKALKLRSKPNDNIYFNEPSLEAERTVRDYMHILFSHKTVMFLTFSAVMLTVWLGLKLQTPVYEAQVKMLISGEKQVESSYYREINGYRNVPIALTQSAIVTSYPVIEKAAAVLGLDGQVLNDEETFSSPLKRRLIEFRNGELHKSLESLTPQARQVFLKRRAEESLRTSIKTAPIRDTQLFTINVRAFSPQEAVKRANVVSRAYVIFDIEQQLAELELKYGEKHPAIVEVRDNVEKMSKNLNGLAVSNFDAIGPASVKIIEQAQTPLVPLGVPRSLVLGSAALIGLLLAVILAFTFDSVDQTIKTPQDIENLLKMPFLGSISKKGYGEKILIKDAGRSSPYLQSYQTLSDQIYMVMKNKHLKMLLLTSTMPYESTTPIVANLGTYFAQKTNQKVLLVDANLRKPLLRKFFNLPERIGLADVLEGKVSFQQAVQDLGHNLSILPAGISVHNPVMLLDSPAMSDLIKLARENFDVVLFDCANLKHYRDAYLLSAYLDGIVLVIDEASTRHHVAKKALAPWEDANANVIGAILNNRTFPIPDMIYARV